MCQFRAIYEKSGFCPTNLPTFAPFWGQTGIFPEKCQHHLKCLMVFYLHAKTLKKPLNGSKDIAIWKIKWSDWSRVFGHTSQEREKRAFEPISQVQEFFRTCGFHRWEWNLISEQEILPWHERARATARSAITKQLGGWGVWGFTILGILEAWKLSLWVIIYDFCMRKQCQNYIPDFKTKWGCGMMA